MLKLLFPSGTNAKADSSNTSECALLDWETIPAYAADVFAFCGYVVQTTGMMGFFDANPRAAKLFEKDQVLNLVLDDDDRVKCKDASYEWRKMGIPDKYAQEQWAIIYASINRIIRLQPYQSYHQKKTTGGEEAPAWWQAIVRLLTIADEACDGIGHRHWAEGCPDNNLLDFKTLGERVQASRHSEERSQNLSTGGRCKLKIKKAAKQVSSLTYAANKEVVCVQPKGRVTGVGCATRNLSRNLSLTGPVGGVRCSWHPSLRQPKVDKRQSLNLLLIPQPLELMAKWFVATRVPKVEAWGSFEIEQKWLDDKKKFKEKIKAIVSKAAMDVGQIHGIIFPEYSLTFEIFANMLETSFEATGKTLEFMVAGAKGNCDQDDDNHVLIATWEDEESDPASDRAKYIRIVSQKKHHRWKLDRDQISTYGLGASLGPSMEWWEKHCIETREMNFFQIRDDAVFASLICEDLARNDPCLDIVRSVAPNLVFALLMDGSQLPNRWSARYAGSLADDPGCTVLTLTSFGLIDRSNDHRSKDKSFSVGLLRDSKGLTTEITLPPGNEAILLTLGSEEAKDITIDGRKTTNASKWFYVSQRPIKLASQLATPSTQRGSKAPKGN